MRIVVLGAGESGAGAAVLAKVKGFDTFVSDMSAIKDKYKELLDKYGIAWEEGHHTDRKSTRLNSSHDQISYAVFCLKKKTASRRPPRTRRKCLPG